MALERIGQGAAMLLIQRRELLPKFCVEEFRVN
jgi:hypothetical protein